MRWERRAALPAGSPYHRAARAVLNKQFPLHADFDAFCIDHFEDLRPRFGEGWDLLSKQNLLLTAAAPEQLLDALEQHFAEDSAAQGMLAEVRRHLTPEELNRQASSAELERLCETRVQYLAQGRSTEELDPRIRELKQRLRRLPQLQDGEILGERFKLLSLLGKGGFARVYQAYDVHSKRLVAVKVLHSESSDDHRSVARFERGARQMEQLHHPHIVRVLGEPAEQDGFHYFVMEYLGGGDLARATAQGMLSVLDKLRIIIEVGSALHFAHERQLIHRDIKPENILLDHALCAKLSDFDLVWAADTTGGTRSQVGMGTYLYAAPEQLIDASQVTASADLFSLGMLTVFVLAGSIPPWFRDHREYCIHQLPIQEALKQLLYRVTQQNPAYRPSLPEFLSIAGRYWPIDNATPLTAKIQVLSQQELTRSVARELAEGIGHTKPTVVADSSPHGEEGSPTKTQVGNVAQTAQPASASTLDPVETGRHELKQKRRLPSLAALVVTASLAAGTGVYWFLLRPATIPQVDETSEAAKTMSAVDVDLAAKRWQDVIDQTGRIVSNPAVSTGIRNAAQTKRTIAERELENWATYLRFNGAVSSGNHDEAIRIFGEIPDDSIYREQGRGDYDQIIPLFAEEHLKAASEARAVKNCTEAAAHVQKVLAVDPKHVGALAAKETPCVPQMLASQSLSTSLPVEPKPTAPKPDPTPKAAPPKRPALTGTSSKPSPQTPRTEPADPEEVLTNAQSEFVNGNYDKAIALARSVAKVSTNRAWRIIGASACRNKDVKLAGEAYLNLENAARQYLLYVCQRAGIMREGNGFKLLE